MRNARGYAVITAPGELVQEFDTFTCCHCNGVVHVAPKADVLDLGGFCTLCADHTCSACAGKTCTPFEKRLEAMERRVRLRAQVSQS